jgi:hypothetical protein
MTSISGNCLCGAVSFQLEDNFEYMNLCHCKQCQRATGSAHASNLFTAPDNITWQTGAELVKRFDVDGRSISNAFCTQCGSGLPYLSGTGKSLVVPAGSLNSTPSSIPRLANIFWTERADWYEDAVESAHVDGFVEWS